MELSGERLLPVPQQQVWNALNDLDVLRDCIPGCESITQAGDGRYEVVAVAAFGPVKARFKGNLVLADVVPPNGYSLQFEGNGGAAGFARGSAQVSLAAAEDGQTVLRYTTAAQIGGKLAQIGARLVGAASAAMADRFFSAFTAHPSLQAGEVLGAGENAAG